MSSLAGRMAGINERIFAAIGEVMLVGDVEVQGIFNSSPQEITVGSGSPVASVRHTFDCQKSDTVLAMKRGDPVSVFADRTLIGEFRVSVRPQPDETGRVIVELSKG